MVTKASGPLGFYTLAGAPRSPRDLIQEVQDGERLGLDWVFISERFNIKEAATLSGAVGGRDFAEHWQDTAGFTRKVGLYLRYPALGAEMLEVAGSHPWVVAWAAEHHEPEEEWSVPVEIGRVLAAADD